MTPALLLGALLGAAPTLFVVDQPAGPSRARIASIREGKVETLGEVETADDWLPRGAVSPDGKRIALLTVPPRGGNQHAELLLVDVASRRMTRLATGLHAYERPRFSPDGLHIYVVRHGPLQEPSIEEMRLGRHAEVVTRVIELGVNGTERELWREQGLGLHLAGVDGRGLRLYRVADSGASILLLAPGAESPKLLFTLPEQPSARDFTLSRGQLTWASNVAQGQWSVFTLDEKGKRRVEWTGSTNHATPFVLGNRIGITESVGNGPELLHLIGEEKALFARPMTTPFVEAASAHALAIRAQSTTGTQLLLWNGGKAVEVRGVAPQFETLGLVEVTP